MSLLSIPVSVYTVRRSFTNPGAVTLLQIRGNTARPFVVIEAGIENASSTTSAQTGAQLLVKTAGATVTALAASDFEKHNPRVGDVGFQFGTAATGHTATAEGTDGDIFEERGFNILNGWSYLPIPEKRIVFPADTIIGLKNLVALTATVKAWITVAEIG